MDFLLCESPIPYTTIFLDMAGTFCIVDLEDWAWAKHHVWSKKKTQRTPGHRLEYYAYRTTTVIGVRMSVYLHVLICRRAYGPPPKRGMVADHKDGVRLDCRRSNLQWATRKGNRANDSRARLLQLEM